MYKSQIDKLIEHVNKALESRGTNTRILYRNGYGLVGIDEATAEHPDQPKRNITGLMKQKELVKYLNAALDGIYLFK